MQKFISQFQNYSDSYKIKGVRIPEVTLDKNIFQNLNLDENTSDLEILTQLCRKGYKDKKISVKKNSQEYIDRVQFELKVLDKLGFTRYILMVWDLIRWCDERNIARGWGRGSVGGSLIAWLLDLVAIDPIEAGLYFERFINESRAQSKLIDGELYAEGSTVPDIDLDISFLKRDEVINEYLENKYPNRTSYISTLNTLSTKLVLKEVGKKFGNFSETEMNKISSLVESDAGVLDSLDETFEKNSQFKTWCEDNPDVFNVAKKLCDLPKNFGVHAAGIVVSFEEIFNILPFEIKTDTEKKERIVCAYTKDDVAEQEIKLDILGLKTVDIIYNTAKDVNFNLKDFDIHDKEIYDFLQLFENTYGVFQLDGDTATRVTRKVKPKNLNDVSAISAIARPGALAFLDKFIKSRESGEIESIYPQIDKILKETSGVILYQEQTMAIANKVYGFSLVETDALRKVIGKKQLDKVGEWEDRIKEAGKKRNVPEDATELFWKTVLASAKYSFNKSHSIAYSYISILCVYLKINYPAEFFKNCLILTKTFGDSEARIAQICEELPNFDIKLLPPDLLKSGNDFNVELDISENKNIRYGLSSLKGVSAKTLEKLEDFQVKDYQDKFSLFESAKNAKLSVAHLVSLIKAGCLSTFSESRGRLMLEAQTWNLLSDSQKTKILPYGEKYKYDILTILKDIKDGLIKDANGKEIISSKKRKVGNSEASPWDNFYKKYLPLKQDFAEYCKNTKLNNYIFENDVLGFSHSGKLTEILQEKSNLYKYLKKIKEVQETEVDEPVFFCGRVIMSKEGKTKAKNRMISLDIADETGSIHCKIFESAKFSRISDIKELNGRLPAKKDLVTIRGTKKDRVIFIDKLRIL